MGNRQENERRFPNWDELPDGGRRYYAIKRGKVKNYARYIKIVDADENTISFVQEVYDNNDVLIAIHQKYPVDTGHQDITGDKA